MQRRRSKDYVEYDLFSGTTVALRKEGMNGKVKVAIDLEDGG